MSTGLERRIAREQPDALNLLGMDRMIRRAYEVATSNRPGVTRAWHEAELRAAEKRRVAMPYNSSGYPGAGRVYPCREDREKELAHVVRWAYMRGRDDAVRESADKPTESAMQNRTT